MTDRIEGPQESFSMEDYLAGRIPGSETNPIPGVSPKTLDDSKTIQMKQVISEVIDAVAEQVDTGYIGKRSHDRGGSGGRGGRSR